MTDEDHLPLVLNGSDQVGGVEHQQVWAAEAVKIELIMVHSTTFKHDHNVLGIVIHPRNSYLLYAATLQRYEAGVFHSELGVCQVFHPSVCFAP